MPHRSIWHAIELENTVAPPRRFELENSLTPPRRFVDVPHELYSETEHLFGAIDKYVARLTTINSRLSRENIQLKTDDATQLNLFETMSDELVSGKAYAQHLLSTNTDNVEPANDLVTIISQLDNFISGLLEEIQYHRTRSLEEIQYHRTRSANQGSNSIRREDDYRKYEPGNGNKV